MTRRTDAFLRWFLSFATLAVASLLLAGGCGGQSDSPSSPSPTPTPTAAQRRSTVDQPDDVVGNQVHVMYVLPSDGVDQSFDSDDTLNASMGLAQNWFAGQTSNRRVRYDTYRGSLDVTFARLSRSDAQFLSFGQAIRDALQADLLAAGFNDPQKIYAVFYGGGSPRSGVQIPCGQGGYPIAAIYLACLLERSDIQSLIPIHGLPKILGLGMIHEVFHNLGVVPPCAPHYTASHVSDDPRDIMVTSLSVQLAVYGDASFLPILDVGRDDYYEHTHSGCLDMAKSAFLEPTAQVAVPVTGGPFGVLSMQLGGAGIAASQVVGLTGATSWRRN